MTTPHPPPERRPGSMAGGSLLAFGMIAGVVTGTLCGQPSIGFLVGLGVGAALALLVWWRAR